MSFDRIEVERGLAGTGFSGQVKHLGSVGSTNTLALEAAQAGARAGVWLADEQTAGRGRGGHGWHSSIGDGLYLSTLVAPVLPVSMALWISLATGLAVQRAIAETTGLKVDIRWPNDLLLSSKKCGGILVETAMTSAAQDAEAMLRYAVIGIGINLNHQSFPEDLRALATSLRIESGRPVRREEIVVALLRNLEQELNLLTAGGSNDLLDRMAKASTWVRGKRVHVGESGGYSGVTDGLDVRGFLRVLDDDGTIHTVISGGVRETR
jgi:BirA family transcriptional regulator, biotin operon repressor / biotin---[acetyl-CoA-carboxylase] ligase